MRSKLFLGIIMRVSIIAIVAVICNSIMLGSVLGVSAATAARIIAAAYKAYKAGKSIKTAISAVTGPGALVWLAVDFLIGVGINKAMDSSWAAAA